MTEPDIYPCAICGKELHCDEMLSPAAGTDDLVCSGDCAESWLERLSEFSSGILSADRTEEPPQ